MLQFLVFFCKGTSPSPCALPASKPNFPQGSEPLSALTLHTHLDLPPLAGHHATLSSLALSLTLVWSCLHGHVYMNDPQVRHRCFKSKCPRQPAHAHSVLIPWSLLMNSTPICTVLQAEAQGHPPFFQLLNIPPLTHLLSDPVLFILPPHFLSTLCLSKCPHGHFLRCLIRKQKKIGFLLQEILGFIRTKLLFYPI